MIRALRLTAGIAAACGVTAFLVTFAAAYAVDDLVAWVAGEVRR